MANHRRYMPLYVGDFLADTLDLNAAETGAYLLLIMHYWQHGGLPDDDRKLAAIARSSTLKWSKMKSVVGSHFQPGWYHKRVEKELQIADEKHEKLSRAGVIGGAKRQARLRPGLSQAAHKYTKKITTTETVPRESKEEANRGSKAIEPTDELRDVLERKGWNP